VFVKPVLGREIDTIYVKPKDLDRLVERLLMFAGLDGLYIIERNF
jgi:hypothetical protein